MKDRRTTVHKLVAILVEVGAPVKGGIQNVDDVLRHSDSVTHCHPVLNLKVGKINYRLGKTAPNWTIQKWQKLFQKYKIFIQEGQHSQNKYTARTVQCKCTQQ